jgi:hypothetical protein
MTVASHANRVTIGRGHSPTAGRKVEAGPQAGRTPRLSSSHQSRRGHTATSGALARGRLRRAGRIANGVGTASARWGLSTYASAPGLTLGQGSRMKNDSYYNTPRIEAVELGHARRALRTELSAGVPLRIGSKVVGSAEATPAPPAGLLLVWTADGGRCEHKQWVDLREFKGNDQRRHLAVRCPTCRKLRKQMFLSYCERTLFNRASQDFQFVCRECAQLADDDRLLRHQRCR